MSPDERGVDVWDLSAAEEGEGPLFSLALFSLFLSSFSSFSSFFSFLSLVLFFEDETEVESRA